MIAYSSLGIEQSDFVELLGLEPYSNGNLQILNRVKCRYIYCLFLIYLLSVTS